MVSSNAGFADGKGVAELGTRGFPGSLGLACVAEKGPGVASHEEVGAVDLGVAVPAKACLVRLAVGPSLYLTKLALLHLFLPWFFL